MHNKLLHFKFRSFTLIELLVVITVIGVLSTVVFVSISKVLPQVKDNKITQDFHQLLNLAENTYSEKANYDSLCQGEIPCNQELQSIYEDIEKQKGTLVIQKLEPSSQSYCAFSPLNSLTEEDKTQYYCIANSAEKIKTTINPGIIHCTNVSFRCPTQEEQLAFEEKGEGVGITLPSLTAQASVFAISTKTYPYFREVTIDPLDVRPGDIQTIMVKVEDPDEINWIRADIEHDNGVDTVMLALIEGDLKSGTWYGRWLVYDTHKETYHTTFTAQNRKGKQNSITLAWTDSCPFPLSGNTSLSAMGGSCEIATTDPSKGVNGVDNGNFTVDGGYTLTIKAGATMVFNPGKSITISNGSIAIEKNGAGGQMRKTYLWMTDQDNDGYSATSTQYAQDNTPTNGKRRYLITSAALDYDDTSNLIYPETACLSSSASTSDSFTDETKIASKTNVTVSGGQMKSAGGYFSNGFGYRKQINISNTGSALTNYQMKLTVYKGTGTDSGSTVYLNNHVQDSFNDIRFTKADGTTLLDYWREATSTATSTVWIEFDSLTASASTTFYIYYSSSTASTASNGPNTFILFDDFNDNSKSSNWVYVPWNGVDFVEQNQRLECSGTDNACQDYYNVPVDPPYLAEFRRTGGTEGTYYNVNLCASPIYSSGRCMEISGAHSVSNSYANFGDKINHAVWTGSSNVYSYDYLTSVTSLGNTTFKLAVHNASPATSTVSVSGDRSGSNTYTNAAVNWSLMRYITIYTGINSGTCYIDDFRVRNYVSPEPGWGTWGSEEAAIFPLSVNLQVATDSTNWQDNLSGTISLNNVDFKATVSGTATGDITYKFDCTNNGTWEHIAVQSGTPYTVNDLCNYSSIGTYTAKVQVTRQGFTAEDTASISVIAVDCDTDGDPCSVADCSICQSVTLTWTAFTQSDLDSINPGKILGSVSYTVTVTGVGSKTTSETSASFSGLAENTSYTWSVVTNYTYTGGSGSAKTGTYSFKTPICYTLTVTKIGSGTVTDTGINCGTDCSESYSSGTSVTLTAVPTWDWQFAGWSGACSGTGACILTMDANKSVTATFNHSPNKPGVPGPGNLGYPDGEEWNHCTFQENSIPTFYWTYSDPDGDPQTAYEIRIDNDSDFSVIDIDEFKCGGQICSGGASTAFSPVPSDWKTWMSWKRDYWWIVRVKDQNLWSAWSDPNNFETPLHAYPWPDFTWTPIEPSQGEVVIFNSDPTKTYGLTTVSSYLWTITEGQGQYVDDTNNTSQYPHIIFSTPTNKIKLKVTDSDGYSCEGAGGEGDKTITAELPLPEYKEVPPVIWLKNILLAFINFFTSFKPQFSTVTH